MVSYNPADDDFSVRGHRMSVGQAKQTKRELESQLALREAYIESDVFPDECAVTNRAIKLLCTDTEPNPDIPVEVTFSVTTDDISVVPDEYIEAWTYQNEYSPDIGGAILWETDVEPFYTETPCDFTSFRVEFADRETQSEHL